MKNKNIIVSTTYGWNPGDDFIREGVFKLLGLPGDNTIVFMNRLAVQKTGMWRNQHLFRQVRGTLNQVIRDLSWIPSNRTYFFSDWKPLWSCQRNVPNLEEIFKNTDLFLVAGTPEWINATEKAYNLCAKYDIPIIIIGVGQEWTDLQPIGLDSKHVLIATTRDSIALQRLKRFGISATMWPDPAIFSVEHNVEKNYDIVLGYRADVGQDQIFLKLYHRFQKRINFVIVNEQPDLVKAVQLFDCPVYYNSDYRKLLDVLSKTNIYLGGRIHGSLPCFASGGKAWLLYHSSKGNLIEDLRKEMIADGIDPSIALLSYEDPSLNTLQPDRLGNTKDSVDWIGKKFDQYKSFLSENIGHILK